MKIGLLTSSRADFGIYSPLAQILDQDPFFSLEIIAFGTHLSEMYGYTIKDIEKQGFVVKHKIKTMPCGDSPADISNSIGKTIQEFSSFWNCNNYDIVLTLGDRYEMFAAVSAGLPFNIKFAHIHAGETTLGAIDNAYRHSISLMSAYLFVSTDEYNRRGVEILKQNNRVFTVGALSIDNLVNQSLYSKDEFKETFGIDISKPFIISTFHPETVSLNKNEVYIKELLAAFDELSSRYHILITMPNSDTMGLMIRDRINYFNKKNKNTTVVENLGMKGYLSSIKHCSMMIGNTSSGFVEAAYFPKWVLNIGNRQDGRIRTPNVIDCKSEVNEILNKVNLIEEGSSLPNCNIYGKGNSTSLIIENLKKIYTSQI